MSRDIIRAALADYVVWVDDRFGDSDYLVKAKEALRLFDEQAVPVDVSGLTNTYGMVPIEEVHALLAGKAIVPIKATPEMINAALPDAVRESDEDKYRAIGEIVCIWDAMLAASTTAAQKEGE